MRQGPADVERTAAHLSEMRGVLAGNSPPRADGDETLIRLPWLMLFIEAICAGLSIALPEDFPPGIWVLSTVGAGAVLLILLVRREARWPFRYRALITASGVYTTAKSLHWGLYYFLLSTEQVVVFEIGRSDLMILGGATVVINMTAAAAGFVISASPRRAAPVGAAPAEPADEDEA